MRLAQTPANPPNWFVETATMRVHSQRGEFTLITDDLATQIALSDGVAEVENKTSDMPTGQALDTSMIPSPVEATTRVLLPGDKATVTNSSGLQVSPSTSRNSAKHAT
jgi:hypothetical protein